MPSINISNYKRPGIFIKEYNNSVITSPTSQGITNLVIGVSKTGPINTPILIQTTTDLQKIFGGIDRNLERKGSFFQRTIAQMLQSSPVYGINLLATDDTLDQIEYAPLSTSTDKTNDTIKTGPYRRFFNTTGFWKKDADSFLTLASGNANYGNRLLNLTNMSSSYITVFIFKSVATGFDRTMVDWYGGVSNIPPYVYPTEYVSDYMIDVVVLAGDWSNYQVLSVDKNWSKYFDNTGLIKSKVQNFINDKNVTLLKYYQGLSFIPYFRDQNDNNIFIENVINKDTDLTGLFCAFNMDAFDTDFPNGKVDLIGNNLVTTDTLIDSNITSIDFLSYNEKLVETISFANTLLDTPGNVISLDYSGTFSQDIGYSVRTDTYAEETISGVIRTGLTNSTSSSSVTFALTGANTYNGQEPYVIIGGSLINIGSSASFSVNASDYGSFSATASYYTAFIVNTTGTITSVASGTTLTPPSVAATDVVLGYMLTSVMGGAITAVTYTDLSLNSAGYVDLQNANNYIITNLGSDNTFTITFATSSGVISTSNYLAYRKLKRFNAIRNVLESTTSEEAVILMNLGSGTQKVSVSGMIISAITSTSQNKSITIQTNLGLSETLFASTVIPSLQQAFVLYPVDNELIFSDYKMITSNALPVGNLVGTASSGIVAKYSTLYKDFEDGVINTGDYFYANIMNRVVLGVVTPYVASSVNFVNSGGSNYIVIAGTGPSIPPFDVNTYRTISVPDSVLNTGTFVIENGTNWAASLGYNATFTYGYKLNSTVVAETLLAVSTIYDMATTYYLAMYSDSSNNLTVKITDSSLTTYNSEGGLTTLLNVNQIWNIQSDESSFKETVEIVLPDNYTVVTNKIIVEATRYSNIIVGDFLEAYVDQSLLEVGQASKNLTRIISKKIYPADTSLVEITCDAAIAKYPFGSGYQTMRYSTLDNYVNTYKAIPLKGFRIREASLPDGTETQQSAILDLVAKGTPLFNAITNKDALDVRYLIDSFGLGLTELSKQQLVDICGARLDCLGFLNMPSMKSFKKSSSPSFVNVDGVLQTSYIAAGGNLESNPAFLYSFGEGDGASCVGYFCPYLVVNDNGRPLDIPPAMMVATTYMRKQNSNVSTTVPWTIAAGITNGLITNIAGVEMDFNPSDLDNLNQAQMNPILVKKNRGYVIDTENTALILEKSALSFLHVRELLIELERDLTAMLLQFQWQFNTQATRSEIKLRADVICAGYVNKNGLYDYFNKCDDENNTSTLIDNQIGVLDTYCTPIKGLAAIVNNITVLKTGAIQSGGFVF